MIFASLFLIVFVFAIVRLVLYRTALIYGLKKLIILIEDRVHVHQFFKVPELNDNNQQNQYYNKVFTYVNSLASIEDSDFTNLFSGRKSNEIVIRLDDNQTVHDTFLGARVSWTNQIERSDGQCCRTRRTFVLKIERKDKRRILKPYLQHIHAISEDIDQRRRDVRLFMNTQFDQWRSGRWRSFPFTHPATLDTIAMDSDLKNKVKSDLESFLKSKQYYHRLGRVWRRNYLLYGPSGTGKSSFVAAMAKLLCYDVYDIDLSKVSDDSDLKLLLLQTTKRSVIVIEDLDRFLTEKSKKLVSLSGLLNFIDGIVNSCCGGEKLMVFTMNCKEQIDSAMLRPGRIDVHIYFPLCDFNSFKTLANSYLGVRDHKLFPQVEEIFQSGGGAPMSPAEVGELMIANRSSPSRALKSVITALRIGRLRSDTAMAELSEEEECGETGGVVCTSSLSTVKEFRKLYGLFRLKGDRKCGPLDRDPQQNE